MSTEPLSADDESIPNPLAELTGFQRDLLHAVEDVQENGSYRDHSEVEKYNDPTGQCIKERVETYGQPSVTNGNLYPNLDTLVQNGLVEKSRQKLNNRTNSYTVSESGKEALEQHREFVGGSDE